MRKVGGVSPSSNGEKNLQLAILFLEQAKLLDATIDVVACIIPRIGRIVLVLISIVSNLCHVALNYVKCYRVGLRVGEVSIDKD